MNRRAEATRQLRDRLRESDGITATITRGGEDLAAAVTIVKLDAARAVRDHSDILLEVGDCAFLVGVDVLEERPEVGDKIATATMVYLVTERPEMQTCWRWHDNSQVQRVIFAKEWASVD